jgi:hypothetical protein
MPKCLKACVAVVKLYSRPRSTQILQRRAEHENGLDLGESALQFSED